MCNFSPSNLRHCLVVRSCMARVKQLVKGEKYRVHGSRYLLLRYITISAYKRRGNTICCDHCTSFTRLCASIFAMHLLFILLSSSVFSSSLIWSSFFHLYAFFFSLSLLFFTVVVLLTV